MRCVMKKSPRLQICLFTDRLVSLIMTQTEDIKFSKLFSLYNRNLKSLRFIVSKSINKIKTAVVIYVPN